MSGKLVVFLIAAAIIAASACLQQPQEIKETREKAIDANESQGILDNAARLYDDYKWRLDSVNEIQKRTDAMGPGAPKEMYVEWKRRNDVAIEAGERLATYITENRYVLNLFWTSDMLVLIAKNKVTFERDNRAFEQKISSPEQMQKPYKWQINFYDREGSRDLGTVSFINRGSNLSDVRFRFVFYKSSGDLYSEESVTLGNIASGKAIRKKISLPGRYLGQETWSQQKVFVYVNGSVKETQVYENGIWTEEQINGKG